MAHKSVRATVAMAAIVAVALTGCGSKETAAQKAGQSASDLKIEPVAQVDAEGKKVESGSTTTPADPAGDGKAKCSDVKLALAGPLSGDYAALGTNIQRGAELALKKHNDANPECQVSLQSFDTEGSPEKATQVAPTFIGDDKFVGLIGPTFSGETNAIGGQISQAGLTAISGSATAVALTQNGWGSFFRALANDGTQGPAVANYMKDTMKVKKVCVINDDGDYGKGLAAAVKETLGSLVTCTAEVKGKDKEFSAVVTKVKDAGVDAVFYGGYYAEAAPLAQQLKEKGVDATFVSDDGVNDPEFVKGAGSASKGAVISCPCGPATSDFAKEYKAMHKVDPSVYSVEGYDVATVFLKAIDSGAQNRASVLEFVKKYDGQGLARHYKWTSTGELESSNVWIYEVK